MDAAEHSTFRDGANGSYAHQCPSIAFYVFDQRTRKPAQDIMCDTDAEALIRARAIVHHDEFEVRQGQRMVSTVDRQRRTATAA